MARAAVVSLLVVLYAAVAVAQPGAPDVTPSQLTVRFKQATGDRLVVNRNASYPGHYKAYDLGVPTIAKRGRYGTFTVYVVTGADVAAEVENLLADGHTGVLGKRSPGGIYWEAGTSIHGDRFWLAKRRYGENVVLWWTTSSGTKKTDKTFKRLHSALTKAAR